MSEDKGKVVYLRIPTWVAVKLEAHAERYQRTVSDLIRDAIYQHHKDLLVGEQK